MERVSREVETALTDLAWQHWTELGVSGWRLRERQGTAELDVAIDPEPLIFLTAAVADIDPRLRDEAIDWCVTFGRYISKVRLKRLLRRGIVDPTAYSSFARTVNRSAHLAWPSEGGVTWRFKPTGRSGLNVRGRRSTIRLRARLIFGVSARAEILIALGDDARWAFTATELAERARYGRRVVVDALEALTAVGLVRGVDAPGARRFALADSVAVHGILGPPPAVTIDWALAFDACWRCVVTLREFAKARETVRAIEAVKTADAVEAELMQTWLSAPRSMPRGQKAWERLEDWTLELIEVLRDPSRAEFAPRRDRRLRPRRARAS